MKLRDLPSDETSLWVFDNDGTLYQNTQKVRAAVEARMVEFISRAFRCNKTEAENKRRELLRRHSTEYTLIALMREGVDPDEFMNATYLSVDLTECGIERNVILLDSLQKLPGKKIVLTNNPSGFARIILERVGVIDLFSHVYGMFEVGFVSKPSPEAFVVLAQAVRAGQKVFYLDDSEANLLYPSTLGCTTILVGHNGDGAVNGTVNYMMDTIEREEIHERNSR